ncbi:MAG: aldehyde ferredoxin oxidoreductase family protein [Dehalococcoidia bacterium]|nr:aldehyde ferredoxin oxidoreductase family protein [Dehalococcoidia bacterium]
MCKVGTVSPALYGKILDVDLSTGRTTKRDIGPVFARKFLGGLGFASKILYDEVGVDVDPLGPDNIVVFAPGALTGTEAPCSGRTEITTKSPQTGIIGSGNTGGYWGVALKRAGVEFVVIRGKAKAPVYLWIDDDTVELRAADHVWGKDTATATDILLQELGGSQPRGLSVLAIGPAGENLVNFACPVNDYHHVAARSGAGAVMGSKRLKAIAVRGSRTIHLERPEEFRQAAREARERLLTAYKAKMAFYWQTMDGATVPDTRREDVRMGCLPGKNFQTGILPRFVETRGQELAQKYVVRKEGTCWACPISCFTLVEVKEGKYAGVKVNRGPASGVAVQWGAKCAIDNLPAIWKCKELCQQYGMDYGSASGVISFAMELFQRGILTTGDTDGLELTWGNEDATVQLLNDIALRRGFGNILAEGSSKAAGMIAKGSERYVMAIKGLEMMERDPRSCRRGFAFGEATNPRGGDNIKSTHGDLDHYNPNWWVDKFDMPADVKKRTFPEPPEDIHSTWEGKPSMAKWCEDLKSVMNSLGICFFTSDAYIAIGPTHLSKLFSAATGWEVTPEEITEAGERVFTMMKAYNVRQGLTRSDDAWPDRFYDEPLPEGPSKGAVLSRDIIARLLDEYYALRGWDRETSLPTAAKLASLGLKDIAKDLSSMGKMP